MEVHAVPDGRGDAGGHRELDQLIRRAVTVGILALTLAGALVACNSDADAVHLPPPPVIPAGIAQRQTVPPAGEEDRLTVSFGQLATVVDGTPHRAVFAGINGYDLTSDWSVNYGCGYGGWTPQTLAAFFSALRPGSLVRTWFFRPLGATNGRRNWTALDRLVAIAGAHHVHLVATLANQNGTCDDDGWKEPAWYAGGYRDGSPTEESYAGWVHDVVARYAPSGVVGMWEPMNEPDPLDCSPGQDCYSAGTCPGEQQVGAALTGFFTAVGGIIHRLDPGSLVADGSVGTGDCGTATDADFRQLLRSPGIDVTDYHDYGPLTAIVPTDLGRRVNDARRLGKAAMIGEAGVSGCASAQARADLYRRKMAGAIALGVTAYLPWDYDHDQGHPGCDTPIDVDSPTWGVLNRMTWLPARPPKATPAREVGAPPL